MKEMESQKPANDTRIDKLIHLIYQQKSIYDEISNAGAELERLMQLTVQ